MLKWLKQNNLDTPTLGHLKRIRKQGSISSLLLSTLSASPSPPPPPPPPPSPPNFPFPQTIQLSPPYLLPVPLTPALTPTSHKLKSALWPTTYAPRRKGVGESWSKAKVIWARKAVELVVREAQRSRENGELPIVAHIPSPYPSGDTPTVSFTAHDTRNATAHPLRHAVMNIIRDVADYRTTSNSKRPDPNTTPRNGSDYLLTDMTLFTTHEPCIMCSMALLHSRVKEIISLIPMEKTGGCGGLACLPKLDGVNHRFQIIRWDTATINVELLHVDQTIDA